MWSVGSRTDSSHLVFNYPTLLSTHGTLNPVVKSCGCSETTCLLLLEGESNQRQSWCFLKCLQQVCVHFLESQKNICPTSRMNFQTCLPPLKPGGALSSLSLVYAPLPSLSSLQMAPLLILLVRRPNASILCLLPNIVSPNPHSRYPSFPVITNCSWILCLLHLRRWSRCFQPSTLTLPLDRAASAHVS